MSTKGGPKRRPAEVVLTPYQEAHIRDISVMSYPRQFRSPAQRMFIRAFHGLLGTPEYREALGWFKERFGWVVLFDSNGRMPWKVGEQPPLTTTQQGLVPGDGPLRRAVLSRVRYVERAGRAAANRRK